MSTWSPNNHAHTKLWFSLRVLGELDDDFATTGTLKVENLTFWNNLGSEQLRNQHAQTLSIQLSNMFLMTYLAGLEEGITREVAIAGLYDGLSSGTTPLPDLGKITDAAYRFRNEVINEHPGA